jgi:hypothetical protein
MQLLPAEHHRLVRRINAATALNQSRQPPASFSMDNFQVVALVAAFCTQCPIMNWRKPLSLTRCRDQNSQP